MQLLWVDKACLGWETEVCQGQDILSTHVERWGHREQNNLGKGLSFSDQVCLWLANSSVSGRKTQFPITGHPAILQEVVKRVSQPTEREAECFQQAQLTSECTKQITAISQGLAPNPVRCTSDSLLKY